MNKSINHHQVIKVLLEPVTFTQLLPVLGLLLKFCPVDVKDGTDRPSPPSELLSAAPQHWTGTGTGTLPDSVVWSWFWRRRSPSCGRSPPYRCALGVVAPARTRARTRPVRTDWERLRRTCPELRLVTARGQESGARTDKRRALFPPSGHVTLGQVYLLSSVELS